MPDSLPAGPVWNADRALRGVTASHRTSVI